MADKEFECLIEKRKDWVRSSKENKFDFDSILAGLYNDPSHFIYEILQNAEDAFATEVRVELFENRLEVYHNGNDFDLEDIDGVTGIGISKKKDDLNLIGKFGVGFKSVFAVTETPYIFSGEYGIKIEDFVIPSVVNDKQVNGTLIRLPFNHKLRSQKEIFTLVSKKLENIGLKTLLFLKNIEEIKWQTPSANGHYLKSSESFKKIPNAKRATLVSSSVTEEYIVIGKLIKIEGKDLRVEVAYKLGKDKNGKEIVIQEPDQKLVVFFPTEKVTFLDFVIQGPYKTTPNREFIPLEDEQNKTIIEETGNLVAESLSVIKDLGYLDTNFLSLLPINPEHKEREQIYSVIYDKVKDEFFSEELLPSSNGKYTKSDDALLARGKELTEFLDKNDIQELFSKRNWLDTNITLDKTRELRDYLIKELKVVEVDFEIFAGKIIVEFLQTKSDEWMTDFYRHLLDQEALWRDRGYKSGILRTKPIIRLGNDEHIAPFDSNGKVQVYLPAETKSKYKTVKRILTNNENSLKFLRELGLTKPDLFAEVKEFILPKYQIDNPAKDDDGYFEDFEKLLTAYETIPANRKKEFMDELSKASFIYAVKNDTGENHLRKPSEIYFNDGDLKDYFDGYHSVYFVCDGVYEKFEEERLKSFFIDLGVEDKPRHTEMAGNLTGEEKSKLRYNNGCTRDIHQKDYEYEGLGNFVNSITPEKSYLLWELLLKNIESLSGWEAKTFFEGEYKWFYRSERHKSFEAKFVKTLRQQAWLVDRNDNFKKPSDIAFGELSGNYIEESSNRDILIKALGFKPEIIDQLPEDDRKILEIARAKSITPDELEKIISEREKEPPSGEGEKEVWTPTYDPEIVKINIVKEEPAQIFTPDLGVQDGEGGEGDPWPPGGGGTKEDNGQTLRNKKTIGKWGENYVYCALENEHKDYGSIIETGVGFKVVNDSGQEYEIVWLNKHRDRGRGYDLVIKKDGSEIKYIEVKTKTEEEPELIKVTGTQWAEARRLFNQNEGEKYSFYVVLNAGEENAQIRIFQNPIKLWKEGKLYAHPVNFRL